MKLEIELLFLFIICLAVIAFIDVSVFFNLITNIHDKCDWVLWYNYWAAGVAVSLRRGFIEPKGSIINDNFFKKNNYKKKKEYFILNKNIKFKPSFNKANIKYDLFHISYSETFNLAIIMYNTTFIRTTATYRMCNMHMKIVGVLFNCT